MPTVRKRRNGPPARLTNFFSMWAKSRYDLPCLQSLAISCESQFVWWELSHLYFQPLANDGRRFLYGCCASASVAGCRNPLFLQ